MRHDMTLVTPDEPKVSGREVRLGVLNDDRRTPGDTDADEADKIAEEFRYEGIDARLVWHRKDGRLLADAPELDVLAFDYGGAIIGYSDNFITQTELARKWADEHPGKLLIVWTGFTADIYQSVFRSEFKVHAFVPAEGDPNWCAAETGRLGYCGAHRDDEDHGTSQPMATNVLLRYMTPFGKERDDFWDQVRSWLA